MFTKEQEAHNKLPVGSVTFRTHKGDTERAWLKVAEPNVWRPRAIVVYEQAYGSIPLGSIIHHENRDTLDDGLENLTLATRAEHLIEHKPEFEERRAVAATLARWGRR